MNMNMITITENVAETKLEMLRSGQLNADYVKGFMEGLYFANRLNIEQYKKILTEIDKIRDELEYQEVKEELENEKWDC